MPAETDAEFAEYIAAAAIAAVTGVAAVPRLASR
jgi:hypothetical protein